MADPRVSDMGSVFLDFFVWLCGLCSTSSPEMEREEPAYLEDPTHGASSSSTSPQVGDSEGGARKPRGNNYEVFLSFRGKDTREGFTDHLYYSLVDAGIRVFRDDNELRVGEEIGPELLCSITQSQISIPIISENYSSSKWCLRELAQMLKCRKSHGQIVLPIFYKVEPSQRLGDAIYAHKQNLDEKVVKEWEEALKEVSSLKGWESKKLYNGREGALVKLVVGEVMSELKRRFQLTLPKELVGVDDCVEEIMGLMDAKFKGTTIMGIYGMGGIGKTTLAKVLYNNLLRHFEHFSFLTNIRETCASKGIEYLQKQLIHDILRSPYDVSNIEEGIGMIGSRFISKKVLIVLDDIQDNTHLKALAGEKSWFGAGSIIIITTRNKSILDEANPSYQLKELPLDQSLILFSRHAFRKDSPRGEYETITGDVVSTTGGLPLALEVIGLFLYGKGKEVWEDTLRKLKMVPHEEVQEKLKISYDALEYRVKQIFLDIACFFIGSHKRSPTYMWDACRFFPAMGLEVLSLLSLIKIDEDGILRMHDQLRDLGREIVRQENPSEVQRRSRLWNKEEAVDVLDNNEGTRRIEALYNELYEGKICTAEQFKKLINLRFLQSGGAYITGDFHGLLPKLIWLRWQNGTSNFAATNFCPKNLVVLDLSVSAIMEDWGGWGPLKMATELRILDLGWCGFLRRTPELSAFRRLEILILDGCFDLEEIHPSIGDIKTLISLSALHCPKLEEIPAGVGRMKYLRELLLNDTSIQDIPVSTGCLMELETLRASHCGLLARLPESMGSLVSLTRLDLSYSAIENLPESICSLKELEILNASYCKSLAHVPSSIGHLTSLSVLDLTECGKLARLPVSICSLASLTALHLASTAIAELPEGIVHLQKLRILDVSGTGVTELPRAIGMLANLRELEVSRCENLEGLPGSIGELRSLNKLELDESGISGLPQSFSRLSSLQSLSFLYCEALHEVPELPSGLTALRITCQSPLLPHLSQLSLLNKLTLSNCNLLECLPELPVGLSMLWITGCGKLKALTDLSYLKHLSELTIEKCFELTDITGLEGLQSLSLLQIRDCRKICRLGAVESLQSLKVLDISGCTSLRQSLDLSNLNNLQKFYAANCEKLVEIRGLDGSGSLIELKTSGCTSLRISPDLLSLKNLRRFNDALWL